MIFIILISFTTCMYSDVTLNGVTGQLISGLADVKIIPFAANAGGTAVSGMTYASGLWTPTLRAGTNNLGAYLAAKPSDATAILQFAYELPLDWDTTSQPYIVIYYESLTNTSGTVIWTVSSACTKRDGSVTSDPTLVAESSFSSQAMASASKIWARDGIFTAMSSGNNCIPGSYVIIKVALTGTASANIGAYSATITTPRKPVLQAN